MVTPPQGLSLLRAIAKDHQPGLIASIAIDTARMYAAAFWHLSNHVAGRCEGLFGGRVKPECKKAHSTTVLIHVTLNLKPHKNVRFSRSQGGARSDASDQDILSERHDPSSWQGVNQVALGTYLRYMFASCHAYAFAFGGLHQLRESQAGAGVRLAAEAVAFTDKAKKLGQTCDKSAAAAAGSGAPGGKKAPKKAAPAPAERKAFQEDLDRQVQLRQKGIDLLGTDDLLNEPAFHTIITSGQTGSGPNNQG